VLVLLLLLLLTATAAHCHCCCCHSPNAVNYTLRDCMVVRCCAPVAAGGEVVINYLGRSALTPLSQRQLELEACYGFKCDCDR